MPIYMKVSRGNTFLLKGEIVTVPYKNWINASSAQLGGQIPTSAAGFGSTSGRAKTLSTDVTVTTGYIELAAFSLSPEASKPFDVQLDFLAADDKKKLQVYQSMKLTDVVILSVSLHEHGEAGPSVAVTFNALKIEHTFRGSAGAGTPSWTVSGPAAGP
jgi:type VI protein secretion system component Hcp